MSDAPASPPAGRLAPPSWLDARLVLGVLLVLVSVVVGARVLAGADRTAQVWSAARDLPVGTVLQADDVEAVEVRLLEAGSAYLAAPDLGFVGYVVERPVEAGELLPRRAVVEPGPGTDLRYVSVPVQPGRYPADLARGQRVDVWATPGDGAQVDEVAAPQEGAPAASAGSRLVLRAVPVSTPPAEGGGLSGSPERAVVVLVPPADVEALVRAMATGRIDLVRVPTRRQADAALRAADPAPAG